MEIRNKTNAEHRQATDEALARHETNIEQIHSILQTILSKLQTLEGSQPRQNRDGGGPPHNPKPYLKLNFPRFNGDNPMGWIYQAEQYFSFQGVVVEDQVNLASFHLDGLALQWHRWFTKFQGPLSWVEFTRFIFGED